MTDEEAKKILDGMINYFGDNLANPTHYPITFAFQHKMFEYHKQRKENKPNDVIDYTR